MYKERSQKFCLFINFLLLFFSRTKTWTSDLYSIPDPGAGEGVPLQSIPDPTTENRDCSRTLSDGTADQDLVPEPADEVEEGEQVKVGRRGGRHRRLAPRFKLS